MKKEINHAGKVISVIAYDHKKDIVVHNRITHDEEHRLRTVWRVVTMYDGKAIDEWDNLTEDEVRVVIKKAETAAVTYLDSIKNKNTQSLQQYLKEMGYSE